MHTLLITSARSHAHAALTKYERACVIMIALVLAFGASLYLLRADPVILIASIVDERTWSAWASWMRPLREATPLWIHHHGADAAFSFAAVAAASLRWPLRRRASSRGAILFVVVLEVAQSIGIAPGTFDPYDVVVDVVSGAIATAIMARLLP